MLRQKMICGPLAASIIRTVGPWRLQNTPASTTIAMPTCRCRASGRRGATAVPAADGGTAFPNRRHRGLPWKPSRGGARCNISKCNGETLS